MKNCETCLFWNQKSPTHGECDFFGTIAHEKKTLDKADVVIEVDDDSGLWWVFKCGPKFGCVHHATKK
jgi:hypothetical protein